MDMDMCEPTRELDIPRECGNIKYWLEALEETVGNLRRRLSPVISNSDVKKCDSDAKECNLNCAENGLRCARSELGNELSSFRDRIQKMNELLNDSLCYLEL